MFGLFLIPVMYLACFFALIDLALRFPERIRPGFFSSICSSVIRLFLTDNNIQAYCVPTLKIIQKPTQ